MTDLRAAAEKLVEMFITHDGNLLEPRLLGKIESVLREVAEEASEHASASANRQWDKICFKKIAEARSEALEQAIKACEDWTPHCPEGEWTIARKEIAAKIRALKP